MSDGKIDLVLGISIAKKIFKTAEISSRKPHEKKDVRKPDVPAQQGAVT